MFSQPTHDLTPVNWSFQSLDLSDAVNDYLTSRDSIQDIVDRRSMSHDEFYTAYYSYITDSPVSCRHYAVKAGCPVSERRGGYLSATLPGVTFTSLNYSAEIDLYKHLSRIKNQDIAATPGYRILDVSVVSDELTVEAISIEPTFSGYSRPYVKNEKVKLTLSDGHCVEFISQLADSNGVLDRSDILELYINHGDIDALADLSFQIKIGVFAITTLSDDEVNLYLNDHISQLDKPTPNKESPVSNKQYNDLTPERFDECVQLIAGNYGNIMDIIDAVGLEKTKFFKVFKERYDMTPREYRLARQKESVDADVEDNAPSAFEEAVFRIIEDNPSRKYDEVMSILRQAAHILQDPNCGYIAVNQINHYTGGIPRQLFDPAFTLYYGKTPSEFNREAHMRRAYRPQPSHPGRAPNFDYRERPHVFPNPTPYQPSWARPPMDNMYNSEKRLAINELGKVVNWWSGDIERQLDQVTSIIADIERPHSTNVHKAASALCIPEAVFHLLFRCHHGKYPLEYRNECESAAQEESAEQEEEEKAPTKTSEDLAFTVSICKRSEEVLESLTNTVTKIPFVVNGQYEFVAQLGNLDNDIAAMSTVQFMQSPYRDAFNQRVLDRLKLYFHGDLNVAYLEQLPNVGYGHPMAWQERMRRTR